MKLAQDQLTAADKNKRRSTLLVFSGSTRGEKQLHPNHRRVASLTRFAPVWLYKENFIYKAG